MLNLLLNNETAKNLGSLPFLTTTLPVKEVTVMAEPSVTKSKRVCQAEGCDREQYAKGCCKKHWKHLGRYGKILSRTHHDPNEIIVKGLIAEVVLYNQKNQEVARTIIDTEDVEKIKGHKWHLSHGYAATPIRGKIVRMSNFIMDFKSSHKKVIDHKDRNPLNNSKSNFRKCTTRQNSCNKKMQKNNTSGYRGVVWDKANQKWIAAIQVNSKHIHIGRFKNKINAAIAYNKAAITHFGEFAYLNKI